MRAQQRLKRIIQQAIPFVANSQIPLQLPRNYDIETLAIRIAGSWTLPVALATGSNGFKPAMRFDAPFGLISRAEVILEGRQTIFSVPMRILGMANPWRSRQYYTNADANTFSQTQTPGLTRNVATASTVLVENTTISFFGIAYIDFQNIAGVRPKDTNVRSGGLQTFDLRLTTSDLTGLLYQPSATVLTTPFAAPAIGATLPANSVANLGTLNATTIDVFDVELEELRDKNDQLSVPGFVQRWTTQTVPVAAANNQLEVLLPTDNFIGAIILAPTIGNEAVDTLFANGQNIIARRGTDQRIALPWQMLSGLNERDYTHQRFVGYNFLDFTTSGGRNTKIADAWNVQGGADTRLVLPVQNPGANVSADVITCELMPVSPA